jgi:hypothetical protein
MIFCVRFWLHLHGIVTVQTVAPVSLRGSCAPLRAQQAAPTVALRDLLKVQLHLLHRSFDLTESRAEVGFLFGLPGR